MGNQSIKSKRKEKKHQLFIMIGQHFHPSPFHPIVTLSSRQVTFFSSQSPAYTLFTYLNGININNNVYKQQPYFIRLPSSILNLAGDRVFEQSSADQSMIKQSKSKLSSIGSLLLLAPFRKVIKYWIRKGRKRKEPLSISKNGNCSSF